MALLSPALPPLTLSGGLHRRDGMVVLSERAAACLSAVV